MNPKELSPAAKLMKFIVAKWISKPIYIAAALGIADMLNESNLIKSATSHRAIVDAYDFS